MPNINYKNDGTVKIELRKMECQRILEASYVLRPIAINSPDARDRAAVGLVVTELHSIVQQYGGKYADLHEQNLAEVGGEEESVVLCPHRKNPDECEECAMEGPQEPEKKKKKKPGDLVEEI